MFAINKSEGIEAGTIVEAASEAPLSQSGNQPFKIIIIIAIFISSFLLGFFTGCNWEEVDDYQLCQGEISTITELAEEFYSSSWRDDIDSCKISITKAENVVPELDLPPYFIIQRAEELAENEKFVEAIFFHYVALQAIFKKNETVLDTIIKNSSSAGKKYMFDSIFLAREAISKMRPSVYKKSHPHLLCSRTLWEKYVWTILHHHVLGKYYQHPWVKESWRNTSLAISHENFGEWRVALNISGETTRKLMTLGKRSASMETMFWSCCIWHIIAQEYMQTLAWEARTLKFEDLLDADPSIGLGDVMFRIFPYHV